MVMIKRVLALLGSGALAILLLRQAETAAQAVRDGIQLCLTSVIPALFPFFAVSSLLVALGAAEAAGRALARAGYEVCGAEEVARADYILLPLPLEQSGLPLAQLLGAAKPGALALGGKVTDGARAIARAAGVELVDYFARPELTVYNAIPTAEGCIGILLERRSRTLWGAAVLVLGFGPVGRALAVRLAALGARVTVAARRPVQRAMAEELGLRAMPLTELAAAAAAFDTVVNTIPAPVLTAAELAALPKGCLIVDLASKPGGTDFAAARRLGHTALHALSLPTVWAPETAGEALARTVQTILQEREGKV